MGPDPGRRGDGVGSSGPSPAPQPQRPAVSPRRTLQADPSNSRPSGQPRGLGSPRGGRGRDLHGDSRDGCNFRWLLTQWPLTNCKGCPDTPCKGCLDTKHLVGALFGPNRSQNRPLKIPSGQRLRLCQRRPAGRRRGPGSLYLHQGHGPFVKPPDRFGDPCAAAANFRMADVIHALVKVSAASPLAESAARCHHVSPRTNCSF